MYVYTSSPKPIETDDARLYAKRLFGLGEQQPLLATAARIIVLPGGPGWWHPSWSPGKKNYHDPCHVHGS
jgi:hypothetical protein